LIRGLPGETKETFRMNYEFLINVLDSGLVLRRINIRQLKLSAGTGMAGSRPSSGKSEKVLDAVFRNYREKIRKEVDIPMIKKVFPAGTLISDVIVEANRGDWSIARPIGTYPIAVNIPEKVKTLTKLSVFIIGYRERSLVGLPCPLALEKATLQELRQIPGLSKKAGELMAQESITREDLSFSPIYEQIKEYLK